MIISITIAATTYSVMEIARPSKDILKYTNVILTTTQW